MDLWNLKILYLTSLVTPFIVEFYLINSCHTICTCLNELDPGVSLTHSSWQYLVARRGG